MNLKEIRDLINLMNEHGLTELEIEREGVKIKLKKSTDDLPDVSRPKTPTYQVETHIETKPTEKQLNAANSNVKEIKSPMVGTFYRSPSPETPPFVEVGQMLEVGQVVCIVEAMKLMNEIKSEVKGKVTSVLVENAQPVEFGQILFTVEPI